MPDALVSARVLIPCRSAFDFTTRLSNVCVLTYCCMVLALERVTAGLAAYEVVQPEQGTV